MPGFGDGAYTNERHFEKTLEACAWQFSDPSGFSIEILRAAIILYFGQNHGSMKPNQAVLPASTSDR